MWIRAGAALVVGLTGASVASAATAQGVLDPSVPDFSHTFWVGGGVLGFVGTEREPTGPAATSWLLRYGYTPATPVTWELAYLGAMGLPPDARVRDEVFATLLDLNLRVNIIPMTAVYPFFAGGVGYGVLERTTETGQHSIDYTTLSVPLAVGFEVLIADLSLESRLQYRPTFFDDEVRFTATGADNWSWTVGVGARF